MTLAERLRFALKPASWPKLLVPFLVGQGLGIDVTGHVAWGWLAVGLLWVSLDVVYVVALNDWADQQIDRLKRTMFPETSRKTIPDGVLPARVLLAMGVLAAIAMGVLAFVASTLGDRPALIGWTAAALGVFALYSLPPVRLNYRGGGELLEALGVGVVLPGLSSYLQSGRAFGPSATMLGGWTLLALASAIASGLSDERSDARGGKRTFVTTFGNERARQLVEGLALVGPLVWLVAAIFVDGGPPRLVGILGALVALDEWWTLRKRSADAVTDAFTAHGQYKAALHALIGRSGLAWAIGLWAATWLGL